MVWGRGSYPLNNSIPHVSLHKNVSFTDAWVPPNFGKHDAPNKLEFCGVSESEETSTEDMIGGDGSYLLIAGLGSAVL